jgi:hypothetical protein
VRLKCVMYWSPREVCCIVQGLSVVGCPKDMYLHEVTGFRVTPSRVEGFVIPVNTSIHCDIVLFTGLYIHLLSFILDSLYAQGMRQL